MRLLRVGIVIALTSGGQAAAAPLPPHGPLRIVVVSDFVNPHGLASAELTEPGDLAVAFERPESGLSLASGGVLEANSQCVDAALTGLTTPGAVDVFVYFAHQAARACAGADRQGELTAAVEAFLVAGGGVVVFHHGLYVATGKDAMLQLLGGAASSIAWEPVAGQRIVNVAGGHFVTTNGVDYPDLTNVDGSSLGVPSGIYPSFFEAPDERYPVTDLLPAAGEQRTLLFVSGDAVTVRPLGYTLVRPGWAGRVVAYQPGEYQPNALDDPNGNGFQILANAIVFAARQEGASVDGGIAEDAAVVADAGIDDAGASRDAQADLGPAGRRGAGCSLGAPYAIDGPAFVASAIVALLLRRSGTRGRTRRHGDAVRSNRLRLRT